MPDKPKPSAVVFAKDMLRVARFYEEVVSMAEVLADPLHTVLDAGSFQLVVHTIPKFIADSFDIGDPPEVREGMPIKLCLPVSSIAVARAKAQALGGNIRPQAQEWQAGGFRACDGHDPEGNVFQVRESVP